MEFYNQLWSSLDVKPDRITTELNKVFTKSDSETKRQCLGVGGCGVDIVVSA